MSFLISPMFSSTKSEKKVEQFLPGSGSGGGWRGWGLEEGADDSNNAYTCK
jgi:hypothetical protein